MKLMDRVIVENAYFDSLNTRELGIWTWPTDTWMQERLDMLRMERTLERVKA